MEEDDTQGPTMLNPKRAAEYLAKKWKRPFTAKDLINLRHNRGIQATYTDSNITLWSIDDLEKIVETIEPPKFRAELHGKPRRKRKAKGDIDNSGQPMVD